jgi:hypothetical protein
VETFDQVLKFFPDLIDIIDRDNIDKKPEIKEIKIQEKPYSVDPSLFPIDNEDKANKFIEYLLYERLLFPASSLKQTSTAPSSTNHYFSNTIKILESAKPGKNRIKAEEKAADSNNVMTANSTRASVADNVGMAKKEFELVQRSNSDDILTKLKSIREELNAEVEYLVTSYK